MEISDFQIVVCSSKLEFQNPKFHPQELKMHQPMPANRPFIVNNKADLIHLILVRFLKLVSLAVATARQHIFSYTPWIALNF
jgi:hypothetical protein